MCSGTTTYPEHGPGIPVLDYGRDNYYNGPNDSGSLPEGVTNMAKSPWIIHPGTDKSRFTTIRER